MIVAASMCSSNGQVAEVADWTNLDSIGTVVQHKRYDGRDYHQV